MEKNERVREYLTIDGIPVEIDGETNILALIRKAGIDIPTFCYHSELSVYGACRMCMIETETGGLEASCSTPPRAGMRIKTNTERLRKYRRMILELLLANHCRDCTVCENNGNCKLQDLTKRFNIQSVRFPNTAETPDIDDSSLCITRDQNKCILCGDCVRMCNEVQAVGAIDFAHRGANMKVSPVFGRKTAESLCVGCGQCAAVCPTGAIVVKNDTAQVWKALDDPRVKVSCQIAPAVRVAVGREFGLPPTRGAAGNDIGLIIAALRRLGFDEIYDTAAGADLTALEEANELLNRLETGNAAAPLFTSCCPAWVQFVEHQYPELLPCLSSARSPMQMFASVVKEEISRTSSRTHVHTAIMPCTAKKYEAARDEFKIDGKPRVDYVLTTQELIRMIRESGIVFSELSPEAVDMPLGTITGAGLIFGVSGGVTEAALRRISGDKSPAALMALSFQGIRGMEGIKTAKFMAGERELRIAVVSGLKNAADLIEGMKSGEYRFDFVEVMACPGGCVNGAGQPRPQLSTQRAAAEERGKGLYSADKLCAVKRPEENPLMMNLYNGLLKGRVRELLHVHYNPPKEKTHA
ncbi:MAG: [FeFe] hydrogenase, group A [Spirochaetaceae bacterium]|jgi:NADH-quinone oxidoreductase subunit G|nr:[FeFe] hydrogenase, group A [Spirochaetaceae bacterium]